MKHRLTKKGEKQHFSAMLFMFLLPSMWGLSDISGTSFRMEPLLEGLLRSFGGSEENFLEVCLGRIPHGNVHTKAASKMSGAPFQKLLPEPPRTSKKSLQELFQS